MPPRHREYLHLYHYQHPLFGFMHARIQTWFPFSTQICLNGREWLARSMDSEGLHYVQRDNCFIWPEDPERTQQLMDQQARSAWPDLLDGIARSLNPAHRARFQADRVLLVDLPERMGHRHHVPRSPVAGWAVSEVGAATR
jgi:hypothetical protein